jgi:hypothetical protein
MKKSDYQRGYEWAQYEIRNGQSVDSILSHIYYCDGEFDKGANDYLTVHNLTGSFLW